MDRFCSAFGARLPVIQAPMAGVSTVDMAVAAIRAGAVGGFAATGVSSTALKDAVRAVHQAFPGSALQDLPLLINVQLATAYYHEAATLPNSWAPQWQQHKSWVLRALRHEARLHAAAQELSKAAENRSLLKPSDRNSVPSDEALWQRFVETVEPAQRKWRQMADDVISTVLELAPRAFSFIFGLIEPATAKEMKRRGIRLVATVTNAQEAQLALETIPELDALVVQGSEAGGHQDTFLAPAGLPNVDYPQPPYSPAIELLTQVRETEAVRTSGVLLISAGGITDAQDVQTRLSQGADAAQVGSVLLLTNEASTNTAQRHAMTVWPAETPAQLTRAFSGRWARSLAIDTATVIEHQGDSGVVLPFPYQNAVTRPRRNTVSDTGERIHAADLDRAARLTTLYCGEKWTAARRFAGRSTELAIRELSSLLPSV